VVPAAVGEKTTAASANGWPSSVILPVTDARSLLLPHPTIAPNESNETKQTSEYNFLGWWIIES
jgi:hypothetical protein